MQSSHSLPAQPVWIRSSDVVIAGVASSVARRLGFEIWAVRAAWLVSVCFAGVTALVYLIVAVSLPREDDPQLGYKPRIFGVCHRIALRTQQEPGLIRLIATTLLLASGGSAILAYLILALLLPKNGPKNGPNQEPRARVWNEHAD